MERVLYFCDGKVPRCCNSPTCYKNAKDDCDCICYHTTNPDYAVNGPADNNINIPSQERPFFVEDVDGSLWEGWIGEGKKRLLNM